MRQSILRKLFSIKENCVETIYKFMSETFHNLEKEIKKNIKRLIS